MLKIRYLPNIGKIFRKRTNTTYWRTLDTQGWTNEMQGIREMISKFAHIDQSEIMGNSKYYLLNIIHLSLN